MRRSSESGTSVVEALVALMLGLLLVRGGWAVLASQRRATEAVVRGAEVQEVGRTVRRVLSGELRSAVPGRDWRAFGGDSLVLRAFRGAGLACASGAGPARSWTVSYRGMRAPNPAKDSVLVLTTAGGWEAREVTSVDRSGAPCIPVPRAEGYRLTLDREVRSAVLFRVFERGSYHLDSRAFRYRIGLGGRQPLTPERLTTASRLEGGTGGVLLLLDYRWVDRVSRPLPETWTVRSLDR